MDTPRPPFSYPSSLPRPGSNISPGCSPVLLGAIPVIGVHWEDHEIGWGATQSTNDTKFGQGGNFNTKIWVGQVHGNSTGVGANYLYSTGIWDRSRWGYTIFLKIFWGAPRCTPAGALRKGVFPIEDVLQFYSVYILIRDQLLFRWKIRVRHGTSCKAHSGIADSKMWSWARANLWGICLRGLYLFSSLRIRGHWGMGPCPNVTRGRGRWVGQEYDKVWHGGGGSSEKVT